MRVKDVLERAGLKATAKHLHTFGSDKPPEKVPPFHRSVEIEKALADGILAWEMNGAAAAGAARRAGPPHRAGLGRRPLDEVARCASRRSRRPQKGFYMDTAYRYPKTPGEPGARSRRRRCRR